MTKPILVFGYGNLSRGDDAVGPLLLAFLEQQADLSSVELLDDFQLQIEHALDLQHRELVIFVDASVNGSEAFAYTKLNPCHDNSYTSHAMSPSALLHVYQTVTGEQPPPSYLLSIKAESFELGEALSAKTAENFHQACVFAQQLLKQPASVILETQWS